MPKLLINWQTKFLINIPNFFKMVSFIFLNHVNFFTFFFPLDFSWLKIHKFSMFFSNIAHCSQNVPGPWKKCRKREFQNCKKVLKKIHMYSKILTKSFDVKRKQGSLTTLRTISFLDTFDVFKLFLCKINALRFLIHWKVFKILSESHFWLGI